MPVRAVLLAKKAHPAIRLKDEAALRALQARLHAAGVPTRDDDG